MRPTTQMAEFSLGDAMALTFKENSFDVAVMPLVIFFVPAPAKGVAEMARVVSPGGIVSAYAWDMPGGGLRYETLREEMRALGVIIPMPPNPDASRLDVLRDLWLEADLDEVKTCEINVRRTFIDFDDYWTTISGWTNLAAKLETMTSEDIVLLKKRMHEHLPAVDAEHAAGSTRP